MKDNKFTLFCESKYDIAEGTYFYSRYVERP